MSSLFLHSSSSMHQLWQRKNDTTPWYYYFSFLLRTYNKRHKNSLLTSCTTTNNNAPVTITTTGGRVYTAYRFNHGNMSCSTAHACYAYHCIIYIPSSTQPPPSPSYFSLHFIWTRTRRKCAGIWQRSQYSYPTLQETFAFEAISLPLLINLYSYLRMFLMKGIVWSFAIY